MLRSFQFLGSQRDYMLKMHIFSQKLRFYEIKNFLSLVENNGIEHEYLQYSLDTIRIIDHVLASHTSVH